MRFANCFSDPLQKRVYSLWSMHFQWAYLILILWGKLCINMMWQQDLIECLCLKTKFPNDWSKVETEVQISPWLAMTQRYVNHSHLLLMVYLIDNDILIMLLMLLLLMLLLCIHFSQSCLFIIFLLPLSLSPAVNFTNILSASLLYKSFACCFFVLTFLVCTFLTQKLLLECWWNWHQVISFIWAHVMFFRCHNNNSNNNNNNSTRDTGHRIIMFILKVKTLCSFLKLIYYSTWRTC